MNVDEVREMFRANFEGMNNSVIKLSKAAVTKNISVVYTQTDVYIEFRDAIMEQVEALIHALEEKE